MKVPFLRARRRRPRGRALAADIVKGAVAGAAATWAMDRVTTFLYARENPGARAREERARNGRTAYGRAAEKAARAVDEELSDEGRKRLGTALHWGVGIGAGALYGVLRRRVPALSWGHGLAYGAGFWLLMDEGVNWALGLTPGPADFPWQTHARGLAGHLVLGTATDAALELTSRTG